MTLEGSSTIPHTHSIVMTKTFTIRVNDMTHARIQSLLQKENYNQTDINKLLDDLLLDQFKRINNIRR